MLEPTLQEHGRFREEMIHTADERGIVPVQGGCFKRLRCVCVQVYFQPGPERLALALLPLRAQLWVVFCAPVSSPWVLSSTVCPESESVSTDKEPPWPAVEQVYLEQLLFPAHDGSADPILTLFTFSEDINITQTVEFGWQGRKSLCERLLS